MSIIYSERFYSQSVFYHLRDTVHDHSAVIDHPPWTILDRRSCNPV